MLSKLVLVYILVFADILHSFFFFFHMLVLLFMDVSIIVHFSLKIISYCTFSIHSRHLQELKGTICAEK
jgi:hypothetical protein